MQFKEIAPGKELEDKSINFEKENLTVTPG